ncbi:MAG: hypothetical protein ACE5KS_08695 [Woeseiaceae bacterium]
MNRKFAWIWTVALLLGFGSAWTQDEGNDDDAEVTIRLMGTAEAEVPTVVTDPITLPDAALENAEAVENAQDGIDNANVNRMRREGGLTTADEARERGAEMAEDAMENRENRGRSEDLPDLPDVPDVPDVPPGPPTG